MVWCVGAAMLVHAIAACPTGKRQNITNTLILLYYSGLLGRGLCGGRTESLHEGPKAPDNLAVLWCLRHWPSCDANADSPAVARN